MIDVKIIENNGYVANCIITGSNEEFRDDLERIKRIPWNDREFVSNIDPKYWRVRNADKYANVIIEIGDAIRYYKRQMRMPI